MSVFMTYGTYNFDPIPLISYARETVRDDLNAKLFDRITINCESAVTNKTSSLTFGDLDTTQFQPLASGLAQEGVELIIGHENGTFVSGVFPRVEGFSTDSSVWVNFQRYSLSFVWEEAVAGSGVVDSYGDDWSWSETDEDTVEVSHSVNAQGIDTSDGGANNALNNAKLFVRGRLGIDKIPLGLPATVYEFYASGFYLKQTVTESADVSTGSYNVTENFVFASGMSGSYIDRKSFTFATDADGISTLSVQGTITGGGNTAALRSQAALAGWNIVKLNLPVEASGIHANFGATRFLNQTPLSTSLTRSPTLSSLDYSQEFSDKLNDSEAEGIKDANFSIDDQQPIDLYATFVIPGKSDGVHRQDIATPTEGTYTLSGDVIGVTLAHALTYVGRLIQLYGGQTKGTSRIISAKSINRNVQGNSVNFSIVWTYSGSSLGAVLF